MPAVSYQPGTAVLPALEIKADKACMLMVKNVNEKYMVYVADPLQVEKTITIRMKDTKTKKEIPFVFNLPRKKLAGSTISQ